MTLTGAIVSIEEEVRGAISLESEGSGHVYKLFLYSTLHKIKKMSIVPIKKKMRGRVTITLGEIYKNRMKEGDANPGEGVKESENQIHVGAKQQREEEEGLDRLP